MKSDAQAGAVCCCEARHFVPGRRWCGTAEPFTVGGVAPGRVRSTRRGERGCSSLSMYRPAAVARRRRQRRGGGRLRPGPASDAGSLAAASGSAGDSVHGRSRWADRPRGAMVGVRSKKGHLGSRARTGGYRHQLVPHPRHQLVPGVVHIWNHDSYNWNHCIERSVHHVIRRIKKSERRYRTPGTYRCRC